MANFLTFTVDSSGLESRIQEYKEAVTNMLHSELPAIANECLDNISSRAPEEEIETSIIMYGEEGLPGPTSTRSRPSDGKRIRFIRDSGDELFCRQAIHDPQTWEVDAANFTIRLGNQAELDNVTRFSWQNAGNKGQRHQSEYGFFSVFEFGSGIIQWKDVKPRFGDNYYLSPADNVRLRMMHKTYPAFGMFSEFPSEVFYQAVRSRLEQLKF